MKKISKKQFYIEDCGDYYALHEKNERQDLWDKILNLDSEGEELEKLRREHALEIEGNYKKR